MMMVQEPIERLSAIPSANVEQYITSIHLGNLHGYVKFDNGCTLDIGAFTLEMLKHYKCDSRVRIRSDCAARDFLRRLKDGRSIWEVLLAKTQMVNFHGVWDYVVLAEILHSIPNLDIVSFTYFQCAEFEKAIEALVSRNLREFSAHIGKGQSKQVIEALGGLSKLNDDMENIQITRLILVFDDNFHDDPYPEYEPLLSQVLHPEQFDVILLYSGEVDKDHCLKTSLEAEDYVFDGRINMAKNDIIEDSYHEKAFVSHDVYTKQSVSSETCSWRVGSRIGATLPTVYKDFKPVPPTNVPVVDHANVPAGVSNRWNTCNVAYFHTFDGRLTPEQLKFRANLKSYHEKVVNVGINSICCEPNEEKPVWAADEFDPANRARKWSIPGWFETRIQMVIYIKSLTEYLTSNGFYVKVKEMNNEADFYEDMVSLKRVVFYCVDPIRRVIVVDNIQSFLRNATHFEFMGTWHNKIMDIIVNVFNCVERLTMIQIAFHSNRPIVYLLNNMRAAAKSKLRRFHFDGRATPEDQSIGSIINAIRKQDRMALEELIIFGNTLGDQKFRCTINGLLGDLQNMIQRNGSMTVMMAEYVDDKTLADYYFDENDWFPTMAPLPYPVQLESVNMTVRCRTRHRYFDRRHLFIVFPNC